MEDRRSANDMVDHYVRRLHHLALAAKYQERFCIRGTADLPYVALKSSLRHVASLTFHIHRQPIGDGSYPI